MINMEGPSLFLAAEQLSPFINQLIQEVDGNTTLEKGIFKRKKIKSIFSWGKHLVFQFDTYALRVHFLLFGTFEADIKGQSLTGDYKRTKVPRLKFSCKKGTLRLYACSLRILDTHRARDLYDFSIDIMSKEWSSKQALQKCTSYGEKEIGDILLDQTIFSGVGNIIKNEVLFLEKLSPETPIKSLSKKKLFHLIETTVHFCHQFYLWRKDFVLRKNLVIYKKKLCPICKGEIIRRKTGETNRTSYFCPRCQSS